MSMNSYTCLSCRVVLSTADTQRTHYKSEWHSYNLKRKLASLAPVTHEHYSRVQRLHESKRETPEDSKTSLYCECCGKHFTNGRALSQHNDSKKHKICAKSNDKLKEVKPNLDSNKDSIKDITNKPIIENIEDSDSGSDSEWESVDSDEDIEDIDGGEPIKPNECLFCDESSDTIEDNVCHMSQKHSFFIPDVEYLKDMESLLTYLGEKVGFGHYCLWCCDSGKRFKSVRSAQQHMRDLGHTKINHYNNHILEYSHFYDFSSSYPDFDNNDKSDEEISIPHLDDEDWQLTLPSGAVIGHRSLSRYYKQNLKPLAENQGKHKSSAILDRVMSKYRSLGWTGITGEAALQRAKDIVFIQRIQRRNDLKLGIKNNRNLQNHFRSQIGF